MTDEEISELSEALDDACREHVQRGGRITRIRAAGCRCPLGALFWTQSSGHPAAAYAALKLRISTYEAWSFVAGFDGWTQEHFDVRLFDLGRLFHEQYR